MINKVLRIMYLVCRLYTVSLVSYHGYYQLRIMHHAVFCYYVSYDIFYVLRRHICICYISIMTHVNISYDILTSGLADVSMFRNAIDLLLATDETLQ